jgi:hypothetical protein
MNLRTEIIPEKFDFEINHAHKILTLGSCFSEVVGNALCGSKFTVCSNPFGAVYNLKSIFELVKVSLGRKEINEDWIVERDGVHFHHGYHSEFYDFTKEGLLLKIQDVSKGVSEYIQESEMILITLGTSWVYEKQGEVVSNCHKFPSSGFFKRLLGYEEQKEMLDGLIHMIQNVNPKVKLILTVSPVRHVKDGLVENNVSKSILRILCDYAIHAYASVYYFPSYEIMIDDLRDYRFYKSDLIHPSDLAEKYIVTLFSKSIFSEKTRRIIEDWGKIRMALNHRPLHVNSNAHKSFLVALHGKIEGFKPVFDVTEELIEVSSKLQRT